MERIVAMGSRLIVVFVGLASWSPSLVAAENATAVEERLGTLTERLASDAFEGRGVGTQGLERAAEEVALHFRQSGLQTDLFDGQPYQRFTTTTGAKLGVGNALAFVGPGSDDRIALKVGQQFNPLAIGSSGPLRMPLVFAGYGITSRTHGYDDYAEVDVKGKAVILLRHEPQQNNPHSVFDGTKTTKEATFRSKVSNAYRHGAAAVIFVTGRVEIERRTAAIERRWAAAANQLAADQAKFAQLKTASPEARQAHRHQIARLAQQLLEFGQQVDRESDPLLALKRAGQDHAGREMPVVSCRRAEIDQLLATAETSLDQLENEIDQDLKPRSFELSGWRVEGRVAIDREQVEIKNVVAVLPGEGPLAAETVIVGAHYDHLGFGGPGSAAIGETAIHNGADDNASGTAVLVEVAQRLAEQSRSQKLARRVVFVAFTGEERGLLGSAFYAKHPLFPLESTVAMINMDMVGRLKDNKLIVHGSGTASQFEDWINQLNQAKPELNFKLIFKPSGFGPSDHNTFYAKQIPVLHFFTGVHDDYHKPSDDFEKLNLTGMRRVSELVTDLVLRIVQTDERPTYQKTSSGLTFRGGSRPYFGSIPDFGTATPGYALSGVSPNSPAARAGLKAGDVIVQFAKDRIGGLDDFDAALRNFKSGDRVPVTVERDGKRVTVQVVLDPPR